MEYKEGLIRVVMVDDVTRSSHVRRAGALDLLDVLELVLGEDLVEVGDDLVEQAEALDTLVVALQLHVELGEVRDGREHDAHGLALLVVQLLQSISLESLL